MLENKVKICYNGKRSKNTHTMQAFGDARRIVVETTEGGHKNVNYFNQAAA